MPSASIEHLTESTRNRLVLVACILGSTIAFVDPTVVLAALIAGPVPLAALVLWNVRAEGAG